MSLFMTLLSLFFGLATISMMDAKDINPFESKIEQRINDGKLRNANGHTMATIIQNNEISQKYITLNTISELNQSSSLADEPTVPGKITGISRISTTGFLVNTEKGNGERRILLMSEEKPCELPKDGIDYRGDFSFGAGDKIGEHTFVVFNTAESQQKRFMISNLKPGTRYYMLLCEANSKGERINYLIPDTSKFTAYKSTLPETPIIEGAFDIKKGSFKLKWNKVKGALTYFIDIAKDNNFKELLPDHNELDVGNINEYLIEGVEGLSKVYCRIRAIGESGPSNNSIPVEVAF